MSTAPTQPCPQCEADIPASAHYCPACGLRLANTPVPPPLPEPKRRWGGHKFVIWFLLIAAAFAASFLGGVFYFIRNTTIVTANKDGGRVEAPFGVLTQSRNPAKLAHSLGLQLFPGATGLTGTQAEMNHSIIVSIEFHSPAPPREIIGYYHIRYPDAAVHRNGSGLTLVQWNPRDTMTIMAEPDKPGVKNTRVQVSDIQH